MPLQRIIFPYVLEVVPPSSMTVAGRTIALSQGWRLKRYPEYPMIQVTLGNFTIGVTFQYETIKPSLENPAEVRRTWCELHRLGPPVEKDGKVSRRSEAIVARAGGRCSPSQPGGFRYELGRKVALTRALKQYGLTRLQRTAVWKAYHDRPRPISVAPVKVQPEGVLDLDTQFPDGYKDIPLPFTPSSTERDLHTLDLNAGEVH